MHAKFAVANGTCLLVFSANLTEFAFKFSIKLGMMVIDGDAARQAVERKDTMTLEKVLRRFQV